MIVECIWCGEKFKNLTAAGSHFCKDMEKNMPERVNYDEDTFSEWINNQYKEVDDPVNLCESCCNDDFGICRSNNVMTDVDYTNGARVIKCSKYVTDRSRNCGGYKDLQIDMIKMCKDLLEIYPDDFSIKLALRSFEDVKDENKDMKGVKMELTEEEIKKFEDDTYQNVFSNLLALSEIESDITEQIYVIRCSDVLDKKKCEAKLFKSSQDLIKVMKGMRDDYKEICAFIEKNNKKDEPNKV